MRLFGYAPERGAAAGDTMPFYHDGRWHLFFSQPPVGAWDYVERARVSTAYLRSDDLVHWEVMPDCLRPWRTRRLRRRRHLDRVGDRA